MFTMPSAIWSIVFVTLLLSNCLSMMDVELSKFRFEDKFNKHCSSLPIIERYKRLMENPQSRFTLFVFNEAGHSVGGLGDRFAGLITAMAYSLRFNRSLIIQSDDSFHSYFKPHYGNVSYSSWPDIASLGAESLSCVNPKPGKEKTCAFYHDSGAKIVKIYSNRCYLCRWAVLQRLGLQSSIYEVLGVNKDTDLFKIAGCLFRLAMSPTDLLWNDLKDFVTNQNPMVDFSSCNYQVGIHFRCGDSSLVSSANQLPNPQCVFSTEQAWKGTKFDDDEAMDSPIDLATCAREIIRNISSTSTRESLRPMVYLASDNSMSSKQINETLAWSMTLIPHGACHVDMGAAKCTSMTLLHWFQLSLSDTIVTQALLIANPSSIYHDPGILEHYEPGPISAFSRYAAIYGLTVDQLRYGRGCKRTNSYILSRRTSGNWVCNPKRFF